MKTKKISTRKKLACASLLFCMYTTDVLAQSLAELLEQATYTESIGDLTKAISLYEQVIQSTEQGKLFANQAMYQQSICYQLLGNNLKAQETLTKLIKIKGLQSSLLTKAKGLLQELNNTAVNLLPTPWQDGEFAQYSIKLPTGAFVGSMSVSAKKVVNDGGEVWHLKSYTVGGNQLYTDMLVNYATLSPIKLNVNSPQFGQSLSNFSTNQIRSIYQNKGENSDKITKIDDAVYISHQLPYLLRKLPLTTNYSITSRVYDSMTNDLLDMTAAVIGRDKQMLGDAKVDCFIIKITLMKGDLLIQESTSWVADNNARTFVKTDLNGIVIALEPPTQTQDVNVTEHTTTYRYSNLHFAFSTAEQQQITDVSFKDKTVELLLSAYGNNMSDPIHLSVITEDKDDAPAKMRLPENKIKYHVKGLKRRLNKFTLRDNNPVLTVAGLPTELFIADFKAKGKEMVVSRVYFTSHKQLFYFTVQTERAKFDALFSELEKMIASFEII